MNNFVLGFRLRLPIILSSLNMINDQHLDDEHRLESDFLYDNQMNSWLNSFLKRVRIIHVGNIIQRTFNVYIIMVAGLKTFLNQFISWKQLFSTDPLRLTKLFILLYFFLFFFLVFWFFLFSVLTSEWMDSFLLNNLSHIKKPNYDTLFCGWTPELRGEKWSNLITYLLAGKQERKTILIDGKEGIKLSNCMMGRDITETWFYCNQ